MVNYSYISGHSNAIAVFKEHNERGEQIFIAYFEKQNQQWEWKQTRGAEWDSPVKWSVMNRPPYIYSGPISDNFVTEVYVGGKQAKVIEIDDDKRFWYAKSPTQDAEVYYIKEDKTKEKIERIN